MLVKVLNKTLVAILLEPRCNAPQATTSILSVPWKKKAHICPVKSTPTFKTRCWKVTNESSNKFRRFSESVRLCGFWGRSHTKLPAGHCVASARAWTKTADRGHGWVKWRGSLPTLGLKEGYGLPRGSRFALKFPLNHS